MKSVPLGLCLMVALVAGALVMASGVRAFDAELLDEEASVGESVDLSLPSFPAPPSRDRGLVGVDAEADAHIVGDHDEEGRDADSFVEVGAQDQDEDADEESDEGDAEDEAEDEEADEGEEEDSSSEGEEEEEGAGDGYVTPAYSFAAMGGAVTANGVPAIAPYRPLDQAFASDMAAAHAMRFRQQIAARGFDQQATGILPPNVPATLARAAHAGQVSGNALFEPIPSAQSSFPGAQPVESLTADRNNYAFAQGLANPNLGFEYGRAPNVPGLTPLGWDAASLSSDSAVRSAPSDLYQSAYRSASANPWPSTVSPPAQFYLSPDIVLNH